MDVVLRPASDRFLEKVVFPGLIAGRHKASLALERWQAAIRDDELLARLQVLLDRAGDGSLSELDGVAFGELMHALLFHEWKEHQRTFSPVGPWTGFAGNWDQALHLALMLEDATYPYGDARAAQEYRTAFCAQPDLHYGLSSLLAGAWDPMPDFLPNHVLISRGRSIHRPEEGLVIADWAWRGAATVNNWGSQLPNKLSRLLGRESRRLAPVEAPETHDVLEYWLGRIDRAPAVAVTFSGLGPTAFGWIRELAGIARQVRDAASSGHGLTAMVTRTGRTMAEGAAVEVDEF